MNFRVLYLDAAIAEKAVDEVAEDVLGVLRVSLDAHDVVTESEHLHAGFLREGDDLGARRDLPHLILVALDYSERLRCLHCFFCFNQVIEQAVPHDPHFPEADVPSCERLPNFTPQGPAQHLHIFD